MRVLVTVALVLILLEVVLALAFWGGWAWLGGWSGGVILLVGVLLLLALPWLGDLQIDYDTRSNEAKVVLSWWGGFTLQTKAIREIRGRFFFIPWRKTFEEKKTILRAKEEEKGGERAREQGRKFVHWGTENFYPVVQALLAVVQGTHELLWESRELSLHVQAPTQIEPADRTIAGLVGARTLGPLDLNCAAKGERRVRVHYQIGLLRAALTVLYTYLQGRPQVLASLQKSAQKQAEKKKL